MEKFIPKKGKKIIKKKNYNNKFKNQVSLKKEKIIKNLVLKLGT